MEEEKVEETDENNEVKENEDCIAAEEATKEPSDEGDLCQSADTCSGNMTNEEEPIDGIETDEEFFQSLPSEAVTHLQSQQITLSTFQQNKLEQQLAQNWDRFYNRNSDHFFRDRHWTQREFCELAALVQSPAQGSQLILGLTGCL